jgi:hypothetical protein
VSRSILTVGPRPLPANGMVPVWIDTGSGPGYERQVHVDQLFLAADDDGQGDSAVYELRAGPASAE